MNTPKPKPASIHPLTTFPDGADRSELKRTATRALFQGRGYFEMTTEERECLKPIFKRFDKAIYAVRIFQDHAFVFRGNVLVEVVEMERRGVA